jgi:tRNA A-37 threonylcarbamoyl transferase component Bud32
VLSDHRDLRDSENQLKQACKEMLRRLRAGEPCRSEDMLAEFPAIASDPRCSLELIHSEFVYREQIGQTPDPAEWYRRFPTWKTALEERFQAHTPQERVDADAVATVPELTTPHSKTDEIPALRTGRRFGRYTLIREIGRGGMGVVHEAHDNQLERTVALKIVRAVNISRREEVERFHREAKAAAKLDHPNIIAVHDDGEVDGDPYYTMAFVNGCPLGKHMPGLRSDPRAAVALMEKTARTVHHAHQMGVIHRDLKPSNILIDDQNEPRIGDFGLAKIMDDDSELTCTGQVLGTPAYMSPEQAQGRAGDAGPRSDVWSLGVILYETLAGRRPFLGRNSEEIAKNVIHAEPALPRSVEPKLDPTLEIIILKCLEKDPAKRYPSAAALADDLGRWQRGEPIITRPPTRWRRIRQAIRRHGKLVAAMSLLAVLVCLLGVLGLTGVFSPSASTAGPAAPGFDLPADLASKGHWAVGQGTVTPLDDGSIRLESTEPALWEIPWNHPAERFRLQVEVEDLAPAAKGKGGVGVYFAYAQQATPQGTEHWFYEYCFAERIAKQHRPETRPGNGEGHLFARRYGKGLVDRTVDPFIRQCTFDFPPQPGARRLLTVDFTPDLVSAYWEKATVPSMHITGQFFNLNVGRTFAGLEPNQKNAPPLFNPFKGSLGLLCENGAATFRKLTISPLPGNE